MRTCIESSSPSTAKIGRPEANIVALPRLKIVHTESSNGWGGQEMRILVETQGMIDRGHDVEIICCTNSGLHKEAMRRGIPNVPLAIGKKTLPALRALRNWLSDHRVDIVNTHSSTDSWLAALALRTLRNPPALVRTRHVSVPISPRATTRWLYRQAQHIITTGDLLRQQVIAIGCDAERVSSVPTGQDTAQFAPGDQARARAELGIDLNAKVITIVATLRSWKGHRYLIQAFEQLARSDALLLIVGDGPQRENLERQARASICFEQIRFAGNRSNVIPWLHASDIFALPSYANEGVPQALVQAMLCGLPIVTTTVGSIPEAVADRHSALVVAPQNANALAIALHELITDQELCAQLGNNARIDAQKQFNLVSMLDRMEHIFHSASQQCHASRHAAK